MFSPEYQRLETLEWNDEAIDLLHALMGEDVTPRKDFIMENVDFSKVAE